MRQIRQIKQIKGHFTRKKLESILGEPTWEWEKVEGEKPECGLAPSILPTAGWGDCSACCRIWIHKDGICVAPGMDIEPDVAYAEATYQKFLKGVNNE